VTVLFYLLPAVLLLGALLLGHFPGERLRLRLAGVRARAARLVVAVPPPRHLLFARNRLPRGGALLGAALAGRAPPSAPGTPLPRRLSTTTRSRPRRDPRRGSTKGFR
jgi:hypothetical protein